MADTVRTICYGKRDVWNERADAIRFFTEGVLISEGSEQSRYAKILAELNAGYNVCSDEDNYKTVLLKFADGEYREITDLVDWFDNRGSDCYVAYNYRIVNGQVVKEKFGCTHRNANVVVEERSF